MALPGGLGAGLGGMGVTWLFWILFLVGSIGFIIVALLLRKAKKMQFPVFIANDLGEGKIGWEVTKAGWFKSKAIFFGLIEVGGERRLICKDKRIIQQGSTEDFHEIKMKRGLVVASKPDDPKILVPIKRMRIENRELMMSVAPADYRDASARIITDNDREMKSSTDKIIQAVTWVIMGIILMICIILIIQFAKETLAQSNNIMNEAIEMKSKILNNLNIAPASSGAA